MDTGLSGRRPPQSGDAGHSGRREAGATGDGDGTTLGAVTSILVPVSRKDRVRAVGPVLGLAGWTLFTWINRIRNVAEDNTLSAGSRVWSTSIAVLFVAAGLAVGALAVAWVAGDANVASARLRRAAMALAVFGAGWWAVRVVQIATHEHSFGFKAVHAVLGLITIALGAAVVRWSTSSTARTA